MSQLDINKFGDMSREGSVASDKSEEYTKIVTYSPGKPNSNEASSRSPASRRDDRSRSRSYQKSRRKSSRYRSRSSSARKYSKRSSRASRSRSYSRSRSRSYTSSYRRRRSHSRSPLSRRKRHRGSRENPHKSKCLGVFGLSFNTDEEDLRYVFNKYASIERVQIIHDAKTGKSRGYGFVYFRHYEDAQTAKELCTGLEIDGRKIRVDYSITKRAHTPTPGIYLGKPTQRGRRHHSRSPSYSPRRY